MAFAPEDSQTLNKHLQADSYHITKLDLVKILLEKDDFRTRISVDENLRYNDVAAEDAHLVEKMRQLGAISRSNIEPNFNPDRKLSLWKALTIIFKYEGVPVKRFLIEKETFKAKVSNINADSYLAPVIAKAVDMGLIVPKDSKVNFFAKVSAKDLSQILSRLDSPVGSTQLRINLPSSVLQGKQTYRILEDVFERLKNDFLEKDKLDDQKLLYGAIDGMVRAVNDPFTSFQKPEQYSEFKKNLSSEFEGIGASLYINDNGDLEIISPISNSPAEKAGLLPGDVITHANGINLRGLNIEDSIELIKGPKNTTVRLKIQRANTSLEFSIVRAKIDIPLVTAEVYNNNIAYFKIRSFGSGTAKILENLYNLIGIEPKGIIIDLRSNPGGYLHQAIAVADLFLEPSKVVVNVSYTNIVEKQLSTTPAKIARVPIVILTNKGTASASEILAAALREHLNAKIIGEKSFGKGTVQELVSYTDSSALKLTIAEWLTPSLKKINKTGILPDIIVESKIQDMQGKNDPVLNRALLELQ